METRQPLPPKAALHTLLEQGALLQEQLAPFCAETASLLKLEGQLAVRSLVVSTRWLLVMVIAAITAWLGLNVAAAAALQAAGLPLAWAVLAISLTDTLLAALAYYLACGCLADMQFSRSRALWRSYHAPR